MKVTRALPPRDATPPHSVEAEQGILGSMTDLHDGQKAIVEARSALTADHFYVPAHRTIFTALCAMRDEGSAIDLITLTQWLRDEGLLEQVGGAAFVTALVNYVPCAANASYYIEIIRDK